MFRVYFARVALHATDIKNSVRFASFLNVKEKFKQLIGKDDIKVPYEHICQIGDPVLRGRAMKIGPEVIEMPEFQKGVDQLIHVMRRYGACGLSGPQIGLPWQVFTIEYTNEDLKKVQEAMRKIQKIKVIPLTIFINPEIKVVDDTPIMYYEGCESIRGYSASVPRAYEVEVTALDRSGRQFTWRAQGWSARIAQHEYDHLQGKMYIDKMDLTTFHCVHWEKINKHGGDLRLTYLP